MLCSALRVINALRVITVLLSLCAAAAHATDRPNIVFILTDDHRSDGLSAAGNALMRTPQMDRLAERGMRFTNAFVTLAICSPSRAACLTGQYGSVNGVTSVGGVRLSHPEHTFAHLLQDHGYATGVTGKWHLKTTPEQAGFQFASTCWSNGPWYDRQFLIDGQQKVMPGFVDDVAVDESLRFIAQAEQQDKPFVLWLNTQVPHMDHRHTWPAAAEFLAQYDPRQMPLPTTWNDQLQGKPEYLKTSRSRTQALKYGYDKPAAIRAHARDYYASVQQMDQAIGRLLQQLDQPQRRARTWIILMGDNGWFLGEHGFTSKVLAYEESMRVPMIITPPQTAAGQMSAPQTSVGQTVVKRSTGPQTSDALVLNIDLTATMLDIAGIQIPASMHGRSLVPLLSGDVPSDWRQSFLYEAPTPQLGSRPLWAVRDARWKYVQTQLSDQRTTDFEELYDLHADATEATNLAAQPQHATTLQRLRTSLQQQRAQLSSPPAASPAVTSQAPSPEDTPRPPRTDLFISGVYPHLTTYGVYSQNGAHRKSGHNECGIGAIVPWAGRLWMVNYAPHRPRGSEHKLYSVAADLTQPMTVHPESVGGTPAGRMLHAESQQLLIGHHLIDADGRVRTISPDKMPIRVTAIARHLKDPANMVYYIDMEGSIWEASVHTLDVRRLFKKPVPGWHGKGGYTSQGRLIVSNNGELHVGDYGDVLVGGAATNPEERGVLAEWDGDEWRIIERRQFTEVTGPQGITGGSDGNDPVWSMGWDRRSVRFKLLEDGQWHTYLLPKASYCNDASHGWYTEWPRIREITDGRWMMDMHGMFYDFPPTFSVGNSKGVVPIGSHLRYVPDFCNWNGRLVLASDETSIQGNRLAGQPQSNLWFGRYQDLQQWGPASGYGGPWVDDRVQRDTWSDPFLVDGFAHRTLHLAVGRTKPVHGNLLRASDQQPITSVPDQLARLPRVTVKRGDWHQPAAGYSFAVSQPVTVYLAVDRRGDPQLDAAWEPTELQIRWGRGFEDRVYRRTFPAGQVTVPGNPTEHTRGSFGMPHTAFVHARSPALQVEPGPGAQVSQPAVAAQAGIGPVTFAIQVDRTGNGQWTSLQTVTVADGAAKSIMLPTDLDAVWLRLKTSRDCIASAFLHQTSPPPVSTAVVAKAGQDLFAQLADVTDADAVGGLVYAAKRNRHLRIVAADGRCGELRKDQFTFAADDRDPDLQELLHIEPEFTVDEASVVVMSQGRRFRLPKGDAAFDRPFAAGWPRGVREVESERHLANIHGTFYELPLITNGAPPAWHLMRPVASHSRQIIDFCSWNGLLVLTGLRADASRDGHVFRDAALGMGVWLGGVDDLWKLGKPTGHGGPWKDTPVQANTPSDAFLMRGYDDKRVTLSHESEQPVQITLEVDFDGHGHWITYQQFHLAAGEIRNHQFPEGYSACWVRAVADRPTTATVQLEYR